MRSPFSPFMSLTQLANFWPTYSNNSQQAAQKITSTSSAFWQSSTAFWETYGSLMQQRTTTFAQLAAQTPAWQQRFLACKNFTDFTTTWAACTASFTATGTSLAADTQAQTQWLFQQWQFLAQRNQRSTHTGNGTSQTTPTDRHPNEQNFSASYTTPATTQKTTTNTTTNTHLQGTFIPGTSKTSVTNLNSTTNTTTATTATPVSMPSTKAANFGGSVQQTPMVPISASVPMSAKSPSFAFTAPVSLQPTPVKTVTATTKTAPSVLETAVLTSTNGTSNGTVISTTANSVSRSASSSATTAARQSVVASRRSRSSRRVARAR